VSVCLFGSQVRGDADLDSDADVAVVIGRVDEAEHTVAVDLAFEAWRAAGRVGPIPAVLVWSPELGSRHVDIGNIADRGRCRENGHFVANLAWRARYRRAEVDSGNSKRAAQRQLLNSESWRSGAAAARAARGLRAFGSLRAGGASRPAPGSSWRNRLDSRRKNPSV
jgi:Nucleotidyltransferase domain